jgi:hypothetical protein
MRIARIKAGIVALGGDQRPIDRVERLAQPTLHQRKGADGQLVGLWAVTRNPDA